MTESTGSNDRGTEGQVPLLAQALIAPMLPIGPPALAAMGLGCLAASLGNAPAGGAVLIGLTSGAAAMALSALVRAGLRDRLGRPGVHPTGLLSPRRVGLWRAGVIVSAAAVLLVAVLGLLGVASAIAAFGLAFVFLGLMGLALEIASHLSKVATSRPAKRNAAPAPVQTIGRIPLWRRSEVVRFGEATITRFPDRKRRTAPADDTEPREGRA